MLGHAVFDAVAMLTQHWVNGLCLQVHAQLTRHVHPMVILCWASVVDDGPTLYHHWVNACDCLVSQMLVLMTRQVKNTAWISNAGPLPIDPAMVCHRGLNLNKVCLIPYSLIMCRPIKQSWIIRLNIYDFEVLTRFLSKPV